VLADPELGGARRIRFRIACIRFLIACIRFRIACIRFRMRVQLGRM
jgi:hypothetical protein